MGHERILVIDDEEAVRSIVAALLERSGFHAITASGAEEALELLQKQWCLGRLGR